MKKQLLLLCLLAGVGSAGAAGVPSANTTVSPEPAREAAPVTAHKVVAKTNGISSKAARSGEEKPAKEGDAPTVATTSDLSKIPLFQQAKPLGGYR